MIVASPPVITVGQRVRASDLDALLHAADDRLAALFGDRTWFAFNVADVPSHQIPPLGAVYVLTSDAKRDILPAPGTPDAQGFNWPAQYDHAAHVAAADALTLVGIDDPHVAWKVAGSYAVDVYTWGDCPAVLQRDAVSGEYSGVKPLRLGDAFEPERFQRYALADVFIEDDDAGIVEWPYDKFGCVRLHNVSRSPVTVQLGPSQSIAIPEWGIRVIRRKSRTEPWNTTSGRKYFPPAVSRDVPMWDADTQAWANWTLKSQTANPIFRQAIIASMFRPHAVTGKSPGLFSARVEPVLAAVAPTAVLAELVADHGTVEVVRTNTADPGFIARSIVTYGGTMVPTPSDWLDAGLTITLDNGERAAVVAPDAEFAPPDSGSWHWDIISRSSNLTGGIIVEVRGASVSERVLRPFFASASDADAWFSDLFGWASTGASAAAHESVNEIAATWVPDPGATEPDYDGAFSTDSTTERRSYRASFSSSAYTMSSWNLWSDVIEDALPSGGGRSDAEVVRGTMLMAVVLQETSDFWHADDDPTWDSACPVDPVESRMATVPVIQMHGRPIGCGHISAGEWIEPRWSCHLLPTIGHDPQRTWDACGFRGSEPIIWTPLHPTPVGAETLYHFRTRGASGRAEGEPWIWSYTSSAERAPEVLGSPTEAVSSGMRFWRVFAQVVKQAGDTTPRPGRPNTGPQPWKIRDHGWLADRVLAGDVAALGETWQQAKVNLYDGRKIGGEAPGTLRDCEFEVGFQIRMTADAANQLSALVLGISHVRPCGWEQFVDGFSLELLFGAGGWSDGLASGTHPSGPALQPYGAVHIYGSMSPGAPELDSHLDALGVVRRSSTCPELIALRGEVFREYVETLASWDVEEPGAPAYWATMGSEIEFCTIDDLSEAVAGMGFSVNIAAFRQRVSLQLAQPGDGESVVHSTPSGNIPGFHVRRRILKTEMVAVPDPEGDYQLVSRTEPLSFLIASERPMRQQVMTRDYLVTPPFVFGREVIALDAYSGSLHDALSRQRGTFFPSEIGSGKAPSTFWAGSLLAAPDSTWNVLALPWRDLLADFSPDGAGPQATTDGLENVPIVQPDATARPTWLTVGAGDVVDIETLTGSAAPAWPSKHHTWELLILQRPLIEFQL